MTGYELLAALAALPSDQLELEVMSLEEAWAVDISPPRIAFVNTEYREAESGSPILALFDCAIL